MAASKGKSSLSAKFSKSNAALKEMGSAPTTFGIINLPGGIKNGIAQVSKCYFKEFDKTTNMKKLDGSSAVGEYFFRCEGTVLSPAVVNTPDGDIPVKGLVTSVMVPCMDVKDKDGNVVSADQQLGKVLNYMRQVTDDKFTENVTSDDLEALAAQIEEAKPFFWFSTSIVKAKPPQYTEDRVFENWHGNRGLQDYVPEDTTVKAFNDQSTTGNTVEQTAPPASPVTQPTPPARPVPPTRTTVATTAPATPTTPTAPVPRPMPKVGAAKPPVPPPPPPVVTNAPEPEEDLEGLVTLAESNFDTANDAQQRLTDLALAAGWTQEEIQALDVGWGDVRNMIENPKGGEGQVQVTVPVVGQTCKYTPPGNDARTKQPYKPRDCQILSVDEGKQIAVVKDLVSKMQREVSWTEIQ